MNIEYKCKYCSKFIISIDFNAKSEQDFIIYKKCPKCKKENSLHIIHKFAGRLNESEPLALQ